MFQTFNAVLFILCKKQIFTTRGLVKYINVLFGLMENYAATKKKFIEWKDIYNNNIYKLTILK